MSQHKFITQVQLKKNHKGNFCADIDAPGQRLTAYLANKLIEEDRLYVMPSEGEIYWADININNGRAFINQLLPYIEHGDDASGLEYTGYCQRLEDGRIQIDLGQGFGCITLPIYMLKSWLYRIFCNAHVIVAFAHTMNGFEIEDWQFQDPIDLTQGIITNLCRIENYPDWYLADYYVDEETFLSVTVFESDIKKLGIDSVTEQAYLSASISFDDTKRISKVTLLDSPEELLENYNNPKTELRFKGINDKGNNHEIYEFVTPLVDGISLSVSAWASELNYYVKDISSLQQGDVIYAHLTYNKQGEWNNFKLPVAADDEYQARFCCIALTKLKHENVMLLEACEAPYIRVILTQSELIKNGIYAIKPRVTFLLHIKRSKEKGWEIESIDSALFMSIKNGVSYQSKCVVIRSWSRYQNNPEYLIDRLDRSYSNYAYHNHCMARISTESVVLLLMIPNPLLINSEFCTLAPSDTVEVVFKKIELPVFTKKPMPILCADKLLSKPPPQQSNNNGYYVYVDIIEKLSPSGSNNRYLCRVLNGEDVLDLTDWKGQLNHIADFSQYHYKVRITESRGKRYVKEIISASIK